MVRARTADSRGTHPRPPGATTAPPSRAAAAARRPERCGTPRDESGCIPSLSEQDRKSTRLNSSHGYISYAVFCLKKKTHNDAPTLFRHRAPADGTLYRTNVTETYS